MLKPGWRRLAPLVVLLAGAVGACGGEADVEAPREATPATQGSMQGGIQPGDILISVDGQPVATRAEVMRVLEGLETNRYGVELVVDRRGERVVVVAEPETR